MNLKEVLLHHVCEACIKDKHQKTFFLKDETIRVSKLLELVHSNVCGPMKTTSLMEHDILSPLMMTFQEKLMFTF
jgi:hypothetical protein